MAEKNASEWSPTDGHNRGTSVRRIVLCVLFIKYVVIKIYW